MRRAGGGSLSELLRFEQRIEADNGAGTYVADWQCQFKRSARVRPLNGSEEVKAGRLRGVVAYEVTVRGCSQTKMITTDWRAVNVRTGECYNLTAIVNPDEHGQYLVITAIAGEIVG